jgi:hypothetical protein
MEDGGVCCVVLDDYCYADLEYSSVKLGGLARVALKGKRVREVPELLVGPAFSFIMRASDLAKASPQVMKQDQQVRQHAEQHIRP